MPKKKLAPPTWDEKNSRWKKTAYCNGMSKTFYSTKRGVTSAEREITAAINAWKDKMEGLTGAGHLTPMSRVKDVYPDFLADLQARTSQGHWKPLETRFKNWILPVIGIRSIIDLNDAVLQKVINHAFKDGGISKKGLMNIRADLSSFVKFCRKNQLTSYRPEDIDIPKSAERSQKSILQPDELKVLFSEDYVLMYGKPVFETYIYGYRLQVLHALRPGEIGGLRKSDRVGDVVHIQRSINTYGQETQGKNDNAVRSIVLSDLAKVCWDKQAALSDDDQMFPDFDGSKYRKHLISYCKQHHISQISPYELRHTSISIMQTLPEGLVKAVGGHSRSMDTFGVYGHEVQGDKTLTAQLLQERFTNLLSNSEIQGQNKVKPEK